MTITKSEFLYHHPLPQGPLERGQLILKDGTTVQLRPAATDDETRLVDFLSRVSGASRRRRFFGEIRPDLAANYLIEPGAPDTRLSLLVLSGPSGEERVVGHAEYIRDSPNSSTAEVAFIVDDAFQGKGIGTLLLERLALIAVRYGIRRFYGSTEAQNRQMRNLFKASGFLIEEEVHSGYADVTCLILPSAESVSRSEQRESRATIASLQHFFNPKSIAIVGIFRDPQSVGLRMLKNVIDGGFRGSVYPVDHASEAVASLRTYANVSDIPKTIDLVVIAAPHVAIPGIVNDCAKAGVRSLIVASEGFAEMSTEEDRKQAALLQATGGLGVRVVGHDSFGVLNTAPEVALNATLSAKSPARGHTAIGSQSGTLGLALLEFSRELGVGVSSFVSLGGKVDVSGNDLLQYWEADPDTHVIILYLESFGNPRRFSRLARRVGRTKPILVVKAGRGMTDEQATSVGAVTANDVSIDALFRQSGVIRVDTMSELFDLASLLERQPLPAGPRVAVVTNARGPAILAADALVAGGLVLPLIPEGIQNELKLTLPTSGDNKNPLDMLASAGAEQYKHALEILLTHAGFDVLLAIFVPMGIVSTNEVLDAIREAASAARQKGVTKPVLACVLDAQAPVEALQFDGGSVPLYRFPEVAARALARSYMYALWRARPLGVVPSLPNINSDRARITTRAAHQRVGGWLSAADTARVLRAFGLPILKAKEVTSSAGAVRAAEALGYPAVVKLSSNTLLYKSEWDGVHLALGNDQAVRVACTAIRARVAAAGRLSELDGFLVQPTAPDGVEFIVRVTHDPLFGPLLSLSLGDVHAELMRDVAYRLTPLSERDAEEMIQELRSYPLLRGYRGAPAADIDSIKDLIMRVAQLVEELTEVEALELDSIRARAPGMGCIILGARLRLRSAESPL